MKIKRFLIVLCSLALAVCITPTVAQDEAENDGVAQVIIITAKEGQNKALEEAITNFHHWLGDKEGSFRYQWYSVLSGPEVGSYVARSGNHNWADFDAEHDWDEEAGAKFEAEVLPNVEDATVIYTVAERDWGIWPDSLEGYKLFSITQWHVRPGQLGAFRRGLSRVDGILKEGGFPNHYAFRRTVSGGSGNTFTLVSPRKNFADMAPKEPSFFDIMSAAMATEGSDGTEEAGAFLAEWGSTYKSGDNILIRYNPELSDYGDE